MVPFCCVILKDDEEALRHVPTTVTIATTRSCRVLIVAGLFVGTEDGMLGVTLAWDGCSRKRCRMTSSNSKNPVKLFL